MSLDMKRNMRACECHGHVWRSQASDNLARDMLVHLGG